MAASKPSYTLPIKDRPPKTWFQFIHGILSLAVFLTGCIILHAAQLAFMLPLRLVPSRRARELYERGVRYTKGAFGSLATLMCQLFAPTSLRVTFETEGIGAFTPEQVEQIVVRDASGKVVELRLPPKMVIIANHQIYADWWFVWCLTYFMNIHQGLFIVLKKSLKWVPVLGWGMQIFRFIFLARSWASDKHYLVSRLAKLGRKAQLEDTPLAIIIYPEGTVPSKNTRPISKKYADKMGIEDMTHTLLPRSTGLQYSLRALVPRVRNLKLLDITVAYPGIPPATDGQTFYTIRSIFMDRVPPPIVHMHLRLLDVASEVPIGDLSGSNPAVTPPVTAGESPSKPSSYPISEQANGHVNLPGKTTVEADVSEKERVAFDEWLRALWRVKDAKLEEFHRSAQKTGKANKERNDDFGKMFESRLPAVEIPVQVRHPQEVFDAFGYFWPAVLGWAWHRVRG
ncbi:acyltransferase-domain-containing protein [Fomitiporia mediterranea MF3/22]|uniref:acyltransferase-domain-containing protein n=1 Tax=Fomitiporia mediterranea (strain MF3/22) TaxID=694068 RepID=UPI000440808E|nr:acyltransferase-domain-containing protein [Fomitiporia mediterranea MF3/22]EJC98701.1 acyltransferase-domain-containing protein [Fomitiporia mediterranea MF3/22]